MRTKTLIQAIYCFPKKVNLCGYLQVVPKDTLEYSFALQNSSAAHAEVRLESKDTVQKLFSL